MTVSPADHAATETLLNCYIREASGWRIEDGLLVVPLTPPASSTDSNTDSSTDNDTHADGAGTELRAKLRYHSPTFRHRYHLPVELSAGRAPSVPLGFRALAGLLVDRLGGEPAEATGLLARMMDSLGNVDEFLARRRDDVERLWSPDPLGFVESEQALLLGHPLHPTPKSREPMSPEDRLRYSPELASSFPLRWVAARAEVVQHASAAPVAAPELSARLAARSGEPDRVLLPAHPWQLDHLRSRPDLAPLFADGTLVDLGAWGDPVHPTTSVRTVYQPTWPWQLKFSLHVRVTNSQRVTLPKELDRAVEAARLWQTEIGSAAAAVAPRFTVVQDPAYLTIRHQGRVVDGFSVLFRQNLWSGRPGENVTSLTSLVQEHPFGGLSRLGRIVRQRAERQRHRLQEEGRDWFAAFRRVAVVSLVRLYLELGLCFEPHQQNTLLELDADGWPIRAYCRDSQGYFHRELAHDDICQVLPGLGEATESIFPEALADERLVYYPFLNLTLGVVNALGAAGCADEAELLADLRRCLETERRRDTRYPPTLLDRLLDDPSWPCKGNLRTRLHDLDELVGDIEHQSVYVSVPNPLLDGRAPEVTRVRPSGSSLAR